MKSSPWKTLQSKVVHQNPWYKILHDKVICPDGKKGDYYVIKTRADAVFVVALNEKEEVCLVQVHRYPTDMLSWEVPAGNSDGQKLLQAAQRELLEETGYTAKVWRKAGTWQSLNGICREFSHVFIARKLKKTAGKVDWHEGIGKVKFVSYQKALQKVAKSKITDGQTIVSLYLAACKLKWIKI